METEGLQRQQQRMAAYLRDPAQAPPPGIEPRRLKVYRELVYNNIEGFLAGGFPVLKRLYSAGDWHGLVRTFIRCHRCTSPYFLEVGQEFLTYLLESHRRRPCDPPYLAELAHYEWLELALDIDEHEHDTATAAVDPLHSVPTLSQLARVLGYSYPVHLIGPDHSDPAPRQTWLLVYRDCEDAVRYVQLNAPSARLLELFRDNRDETGLAVLARLAGEMGMAPEAVREFAAPLLSEWSGARVLIRAP